MGHLPQDSRPTTAPGRRLFNVTEPGTATRPLTVLLVDADERIRESLAGLLEIGGRCLVVASASEPGDALELVDRHRPDVVVLDPRLPAVDRGRALIAAIRERRPATRVVVMGVADALEAAGFEGTVDVFVRKTFRPRELLDAIYAATTPSPPASTPDH
jgi:CheY-like chemotaxis protein